MTNEDLGYNETFEANRQEAGFSNFPVARVVAVFKDIYPVRNAGGEYQASLSGKYIFESAGGSGTYPAVGDWVAIEVPDSEHAVIHGVLKRQSVLSRTHGDRSKASHKKEIQIIAANVDVAFIVESVDRDYSVNRFERYFAIAHEGGVKPVVVLNKIDLVSTEDLEQKREELKSRFPDVEVLAVTVRGDAGLEELRACIARGATYCFLGSSGVGKSSIINELLGEDTIRTGAVSAYSGRGTHTTTNRQMYILQNGSIVIDNPGVREVGVVGAESGIDSFFSEFSILAEDCKYADCTHTQEPGCTIVAAVERGELDKGQYENYLTLRKEAGYREMSDTDKKEKDRKFGKFKKVAKREQEALEG